jgi:hypothetical protein
MQPLVERVGRAVTSLIALVLVLVPVLALAEAATGVDMLPGFKTFGRTDMLPGSHETGNQPGAD